MTTPTARKLPVQKRSRAMVDSLLEATTRILVRDGWDGLSTNQVAKLAGVSVGSLYQYFPSKEALVKAVLEQWGQRLMADMMALAASFEREGASLDDAVKAVVKASLDLCRVDPVLQRALAQNVPRLGVRDEYENLNRRLVELLANWLSEHEELLGVDDPAMAAHVVVHVLDGLTENALLYRPELVHSARFQRHLERLVGNYLRRDVKPSKRGRKR
ncbi:MAG: TetR family transcriptional regulator [Myxococcaceae bacterium]|nr:TetR family transcriptional regulator [Myxococcaceae bacterium]